MATRGEAFLLDRTDRLRNFVGGRLPLPLREAQLPQRRHPRVPRRGYAVIKSWSSVSRNSRYQPASKTVHDNFVRAAARAGSPAFRIDEGGVCPLRPAPVSPRRTGYTTKHGFLSSDYPPDFLRPGHASCQLPPLRSGITSPPAWRPSTSTAITPISIHDILLDLRTS